MSVIEGFAAFAADLRLGELTAARRERLRLHVLDTVGAAIVGAATPEGRALGNLRAAAIDDVTLRCATARLTEIDDIHMPSNTTPGAIVVPVALTVAARIGNPSPDAFAAAVLAGYEAMARLGCAINGPEVLYKGVWPTFFCAPFGAAATAARLLELPVERYAHALAIALAFATGGAGRPQQGLTARWLLAGQAAANGCLAADAAAAGYSGDRSLLDGDWLATVHGLAAQAVNWPDDGASVLDALSIKPWCSAKQLVAALHGFREILAGGVAADDIGTVTIAAPRRYAAMIGAAAVAGNRLSTISSAAYQLALAAHGADGLYDVARAEFAPGEDFRAFMDRVEVVADDGLARHLPARWPARVTVRTGPREETLEVVDAPGDPALPFDLAQTTEKFHRFADPAIGAEAADEWIGLAHGAIDDSGALASLCTRFDGLFAV